MNAVSGTGARIVGPRLAGGTPIRADRASSLVTLDLDGEHPPGPPAMRSEVLSTRVPANLAAFVRESAAGESVTPAVWLHRLIAQRRSDGPQLPADVRSWLTVQAAQCGCPGDPDRALVMVLRHLADRWPDGARLRP